MRFINGDTLGGIERKKVLELGDHRRICSLWNIEKFVHRLLPKPPRLSENAHDDLILDLGLG